MKIRGIMENSLDLKSWKREINGIRSMNDLVLTEEVVMRKLTGHKVKPANYRLDIEVMDERGSGNANHHYRVTGFDNVPPSQHLVPPAGVPAADVIFQNGPIPEAGVNGLTHEVLLEIIADRLRGFQEGPYACTANKFALMHIVSAQKLLLLRTRERMSRNVEGTHEV